MNRDQWFWVFATSRDVQSEIERICGLLVTEGLQDDDEFLPNLMEGLVQCCANVASRMEVTDAETPVTG